MGGFLLLGATQGKRRNGATSTSGYEGPGHDGDDGRRECDVVYCRIQIEPQLVAPVAGPHLQGPSEGVLVLFGCNATAALNSTCALVATTAIIFFSSRDFCLYKL